VVSFRGWIKTGRVIKKEKAMRKTKWVFFLAATMLVCTFAYSRVARAQTKTSETSAVCNDENVAGLGGFNDEAFCPTGSTATGGGYELVSSDFSQLLGASVNESMPAFSGAASCNSSIASPPPCGWEVVGSNTTTIAGKIRVCVLCAKNE
jgi:hypothetical protein